MTGLSATGYAFLGLTVIVAMLVAIVMFAVLRFTAAARETRRNLGDSRVESVLLASALEEAIGKLKAQERATAERAEASEQLSGEIVSSLTSGLIVADREGAVQIVNPAARRILKLRDQTQVSDAVWEEVPELRDVILESLQTKAPILRRTLALNRPEGTMHLGVTVSPLGAGSTTRGAICLFTDLTSVMALEERLRLKEALAQLGELTAGLAHEFRNGLATIHGYGWLLDPSVLPPQQRPYVEGIREETHALGEVVTNFLRFARPEPLALAPVDLRSLVESAAEDAPSARFTISGDLGRVDADEVLLRQALSNLFRNSVEACAAVNRATEIGVEARLDHIDNTVTLTVTDNGPGIQPEAMSRLFQPFFTTRPNGSGLGLAIVQKVVVSHNGRVSAANRSDGGAAFQLTLPLAAA